MFKHVAAMRAADNFSPESPRPAKTDCALRTSVRFAALLVLTLIWSGCNRLATPPEKQLLKDAAARVADGDFLLAINLYEEALDGSERSAEIHYRMALLYDDKMNDPLNALHHFKRYLTLAPTGPRAEEVKIYMKKDELTLATTLSGDSVLSRAEATRLKNENLKLQQQLDERQTQVRAAAAVQKKSSTRPVRNKTPSHSKKRSAKRDTPSP